MTAKTSNVKYVRHRLFPRIRHRKKLSAFLAAVASSLSATATGQTVAPKRATNTVPEATVVFAGQPAGNDTVTIGGLLYKFVAALTEVFASATLTNDGTNVTNGDTVTIGTKVYTFQTTLTNVDGNVHIGAANTNSMTNLFNAINGTGGTPGTDYAAATVAHTLVTATNPTGTTVVVTAKATGTAGNGIATTETSTHLSWGGASTAGGVAAAASEVKIGAAAANTRDNLVAAITAGAGAGTLYSSLITAHPSVTASASGSDALVQGKTGQVFNVAISETSANLSIANSQQFLDGPLWTATGHGLHDGEGPCLLSTTVTLPTGVTATEEVWVHVVDANTIALATSQKAIQQKNFVHTTDLGTGTHTLKRSVTAQGILDALKTPGNNAARVAAATDVDTLA